MLIDWYWDKLRLDRSKCNCHCNDSQLHSLNNWQSCCMCDKDSHIYDRNRYSQRTQKDSLECIDCYCWENKGWHTNYSKLHLYNCCNQLGRRYSFCCWDKCLRDRIRDRGFCKRYKMKHRMYNLKVVNCMSDRVGCTFCKYWNWLRHNNLNYRRSDMYLVVDIE